MSKAIKGEEKWVLDGFHNLRSHANDEERSILDQHADKMMLDPKMKNLLMAASDYEPGSKPLDQIMNHLKKGLDKK